MKDIIKLAKQAHGPITSRWWDMDVAALERFAALVRAAALEEAAVVCEETANDSGWDVSYGYARHCAAAIRALKEKT